MATFDLLPGWQILAETILYRPSAAQRDNRQVYVFDLDNTLITTRSGKKFPQNAADWQWLYPNVPDQLRFLSAVNFRLVVYSNQAKAGTNPEVARQLMEKCDAISAALSTTEVVDISFLLATCKDNRRKPHLYGWQQFVSHHNPSFDPELALYVGDAAGRPAGWKAGKPADFANTDATFAFNLDTRFFTPEEFFLHEPVYQGLLFPNWQEYLTEDPEEKTDLACPDTQEMIILVGYPGCGKSTLSATYPATTVCRDVLLTPSKCQKAARRALTEKRSVIVDSTNPSKVSRAPYLAMAREFAVPARCLLFTASRELAQHLNFYRERVSGKKAVPDIAYNIYQSKYEEPTLEEGFTSIVRAPFCPRFTEEEQAMFILHP